MRMVLYHAPCGRLLGWCLTDERLGVDLRT
jgi:hypothetical protein